MENTGRHLVYRVYGNNGELLYVGVSWNPFAVVERHCDVSPYWEDVASIKLDWFDSISQALEGESSAIASEHPKYMSVYG